MTPIVSSILEIAKIAKQSVVESSQISCWWQQNDAGLAVFSYKEDFSHLWGISDENVDLKTIAGSLSN